MAVPENIGRWQSKAKVVVQPVFRALWKISVEGIESIPTTGPAILAPNHISVIDSFVLPAVLDRRVTFVGKAEYLDDWKTRTLFPALGMIPIDRSGGESAKAALAAAASVLKAGQLFAIYPEGTRTRTGNLHKGRTGAARLAFETGAPIIPIGLRGTREIQPPDAPFPKPFQPAEVKIGAPIHPSIYGDPERDPLAPRRMTDDVMFAIQALSGQKYVHEYANSSRAGGAAAGASGDSTDRRPDVVVDSPLTRPRSSADVLKPVPIPA